LVLQRQVYDIADFAAVEAACLDDTDRLKQELGHFPPCPYVNMRWRVIVRVNYEAVAGLAQYSDHCMIIARGWKLGNLKSLWTVVAFIGCRFGVSLELRSQGNRGSSEALSDSVPLRGGAGYNRQNIFKEGQRWF